MREDCAAAHVQGAPLECVGGAPAARSFDSVFGPSFVKELRQELGQWLQRQQWRSNREPASSELLHGKLPTAWVSVEQLKDGPAGVGAEACMVHRALAAMLSLTSNGWPAAGTASAPIAGAEWCGGMQRRPT